jgi:hypothetical protein
MLASFSARERDNLHRWLNQISDAQMPDSNWNYFAILVQLGFKRAGLPWDREAIERRFNLMEAYYLGDGWYSDGPGRPKDYYISMAFHFYGLIYATLNGEDDPGRAACLRERAALFARDFIYMSASGGESVPFGRSLTYRFAMVAFWSAVAFAGLNTFSPGVVKGLILRHLRWWLRQPIFDRDGILTLGFAYPNLAMCEDYNSPGSPYWALKVFWFWRCRKATPSGRQRAAVTGACRATCRSSCPANPGAQRGIPARLYADIRTIGAEQLRQYRGQIHQICVLQRLWFYHRTRALRHQACRQRLHAATERRR